MNWEAVGVTDQLGNVEERGNKLFDLYVVELKSLFVVKLDFCPIL